MEGTCDMYKALGSIPSNKGKGWGGKGREGGVGGREEKRKSDLIWASW